MLVHRLVQRNQRLLQKAPEPLADQQLRQVVLQFADAMLCQKLDRGLDFRRQRQGILDGDAQHRLQRRFRQRNNRARTPAFGQQLLDDLEPRDLIGRIDAVTESVACRIRKPVASLPHVQLFASEAGDSYHLTDVQ